SLLTRRREHLVGIRIEPRRRDAIEAEVGRLVAVVTGGRERVVRAGERRGVFATDGCANVGERLRDHSRNRIPWCDGRVLVRGMELDDVVEALAELVNLVAAELPLAGL